MRAYRTISIFLIGAAYSLNLPAGMITEVPFDYHRGEILVSVRIGETGPWTMMVDTGTDPSVISPRVAETAGIDLHPAEGEVEGGGTETIEVMEASIPLLVLGKLEVRNLATAVLDLSALAERLERDLDGILGHSLLEGRIVRIDFPNRRFAFLDRPPAGREPTSSDSPLALLSPFVYEDGVLIDAVTINNVPGRGLIDTGSNGLFKLAPAAVATFGLEENLARAAATTQRDNRGCLGIERGRWSELR